MVSLEYECRMWQDFFKAAAADPVEFLSLQYLEQFRASGGSLEPDQLLNVYPPFCVKQSAEGVIAGDSGAFADQILG